MINIAKKWPGRIVVFSRPRDGPGSVPTLAPSTLQACGVISECLWMSGQVFSVVVHYFVVDCKKKKYLWPFLATVSYNPIEL